MSPSPRCCRPTDAQQIPTFPGGQQGSKKGTGQGGAPTCRPGHPWQLIWACIQADTRADLLQVTVQEVRVDVVQAAGSGRGMTSCRSSSCHWHRPCLARPHSGSPKAHAAATTMTTNSPMLIPSMTAGPGFEQGVSKGVWGRRAAALRARQVWKDDCAASDHDWCKRTRAQVLTGRGQHRCTRSMESRLVSIDSCPAFAFQLLPPTPLSTLQTS